MASLSFYLAGLIPLILVLLFAPELIFISFLFVFPYLIWISLGLILLYSTAISEKISGFSAIRRTLQLTRGNRGTLFAVSTIVGILAALPGATISQFLLLVPSDVLNYVENSTLGIFSGMLFSIPITTSSTVILYRYFHAKFHN